DAAREDAPGVKGVALVLPRGLEDLGEVMRLANAKAEGAPVGPERGRKPFLRHIRGPPWSTDPCARPTVLATLRPEKGQARTRAWARSGHCASRRRTPPGRRSMASWPSHRMRRPSRL